MAIVIVCDIDDFGTNGRISILNSDPDSQLIRAVVTSAPQLLSFCGLRRFSELHFNGVFTD